VGVVVVHVNTWRLSIIVYRHVLSSAVCQWTSVPIGQSVTATGASSLGQHVSAHQGDKKFRRKIKTQ